MRMPKIWDSTHPVSLFVLRRLVVVLCTVLCVPGCVTSDYSRKSSEPIVSTEGVGTLDKLPFTEGWQGTYFKEDKIGYSHYKIEPEGENFAITNESEMNLKGVSDGGKVSMKERVLVRPDLTLISFDTSATMHGRHLKLEGTARDKKLAVVIDIDGEKVEPEIDIPADTYHASAVELMPALKGLRDGAEYRFKVFNPGNQQLADIKQTLRKVTDGIGPEGAAWRMTVTYGKNEVNTWLNRSGQAILSKQFGGAVISKLETKEKALAQTEGASDGTDIFEQKSRIPVDTPIDHPEKTTFLKARMSGIDSVIIPGDHRQTVFASHTDKISDPFGVEVRVEDVKALSERKRPLPEPSALPHLRSTRSIQADDKAVIAKAKEIAGDAKSSLQKVRKLVEWVADNIEQTKRLSLDALEVLRVREGECQAHALLYIALARALDIPTRIVYGLVYSEDGGFRYHAWAESYADGWLAVDPTLKQVPADATHIKLFTGESSYYRDTLMSTVGNVRIEIVDVR